MGKLGKMTELTGKVVLPRNEHLWRAPVEMVGGYLLFIKGDTSRQ